MAETKSKTWSVYTGDGERLVVVADSIRKALTAAEVAGKNPVAVAQVGGDAVVISETDDVDESALTESPI